MQLTIGTRFSSQDAIHTLAVVAVTTALGIGVAFAAINGAGEGMGNSALSSLSSAPGISLSHAFGPNDEDCLYATQQALPGGHTESQLVCDR